jgi:hypothetical protein
MAEQRTFNPLVRGSTPRRPTSKSPNRQNARRSVSGLAVTRQGVAVLDSRAGIRVVSRLSWSIRAWRLSLCTMGLFQSNVRVRRVSRVSDVVRCVPQLSRGVPARHGCPLRPRPGRLNGPSCRLGPAQWSSVPAGRSGPDVRAAAAPAAGKRGMGPAGHLAVVTGRRARHAGSTGCSRVPPNRPARLRLVLSDQSAGATRTPRRGPGPRRGSRGSRGSAAIGSSAALAGHSGKARRPQTHDTNRKVPACPRSDPHQAADLVITVLAEPARRRMFAIANVRTNRGDL